MVECLQQKDWWDAPCEFERECRSSEWLDNFLFEGVFDTGFSQIQRIESRTRVSNLDDSDLLDVEYSYPLVYVLVSNKYATLKELKEYSVEETLQLYEICMVNLYNSWMVRRGDK